MSYVGVRRAPLTDQGIRAERHREYHQRTHDEARETRRGLDVIREGLCRERADWPHFDNHSVSES